MSRWNPVNESYREPGPPRQYDLGTITKRCPCDGGLVIRIGSSSWNARCVQCSRQFDYDNLRGLSVQPRSPFPVIPMWPTEQIGNRPRANYQQPGTEAPPPHAQVANYPLKPPASQIVAPTENYQQTDYRVPETDVQVARHYGVPRSPQ